MSDAKTIALIKALGGGGGGGGSSFSPDISNPQDGQVLVYDGTAGKWVNGAASGGGSGALYVELSDNALNKNYTEITQAVADGKIVATITTDDDFSINYLASAYEGDGKYYVNFMRGEFSNVYVADTATGTLTLDEDDPI